MSQRKESCRIRRFLQVPRPTGYQQQLSRGHVVDLHHLSYNRIRRHGPKYVLRERSLPPDWHHGEQIVITLTDDAIPGEYGDSWKLHPPEVDVNPPPPPNICTILECVWGNVVHSSRTTFVRSEPGTDRLAISVLVHPKGVW